MCLRALIRLVIVLSLGTFSVAALGNPVDDFNAAYESANATAKQAHALKNEWISIKDGHKWTTAQALKEAVAQAAVGKYEEAIKLANEAETLAHSEIAQAKEQASNWPQAVIR